MIDGKPIQPAKGHRSIFSRDAKIAARLGALYETLTTGGRAAAAPQEQGSPVIRHHARVEHVRRELETLEALRAAFAAIVDRLQFGLVLLDGGGRIVRANDVARAMFRGHHGLCVRRGRLVSSDRAQTVALQQAIHRAVSASDGSGPLAGTELVPLGSGSDRRRVAALILPLSPPRTGLLQDGPVAAVFLSGPESGSSSHVGLLGQLFGFTTRESEVACALLEGRSPKQTATRLGISVHTVRTHLKRILETTYARRQAELVRLLSLAIPPIRFS